MRVRQMTEPDSPSVREIWNQAAIFDPVTEDVFAEKVWADPDIADDFRVTGEIDGDMAGFAVGAVRSKDVGVVGYVKMIAVSPAMQRRGLGSMMLAQLEETMRSKGVVALRPGESAPNYLTPGVDVRYTKANVFLENRGYERIGQSCNMEADLRSQSFDTTSEELSLSSMGFELRRAKTSDRSAVMSMLAAIWPSWRDEVGVAFSNDPISLYVAIHESEVVAFSAYETNNRGSGWFGPMGTAPEARGRGIGSLLLKRCLADMQEAGFERAIIPWVAPIAFYLHYVGAEVRRVFFRYEKKTGNDGAE